MKKRKYLVFLSNDANYLLLEKIQSIATQHQDYIALQCDSVNTDHHYLVTISLKTSKDTYDISFPYAYLKAIFLAEHLKNLGFGT